MNPQPDNSPVLSYLSTYSGYACLHCSTSLTTTKSVLSYLSTYPYYACLHCSISLTTTRSMSLHIGKTHDIHSHYKVHYKPVMLQTWYNQPGRLRDFWIVNTTTPQPALLKCPTPSPADRMLEDMLEEDEELLVEELNADDYTHTEGYTWYDTNMWLTRM